MTTTYQPYHGIREEQGALTLVIIAGLLVVAIVADFARSYVVPAVYFVAGVGMILKFNQLRTQ